MSYRNITPLEIRISKKLTAVAPWLKDKLKKRFQGEVDYILIVTPKRAKGEPLPADFQDSPICSYISTSDRETSAMVITETLHKWISNKECPPLHEMKDANGRTLADILGAGLH